MTMIPLRVHAAVTLLLAAAGVWIVVAPTAVGFQPDGAAWAPGTYNDVIVGGLLVVVSLGLLTAQITATVRARLRAATS